MADLPPVGKSATGVVRRSTSNVRRILVPTDFSPASTGALKFACRLAEKIEGELIVLYVALPLAGGRKDCSSLEAHNRESDLHRHAEEMLTAQLNENTGRSVGNHPIQTVVSDGYAHRGIVREALAREVDLIVIGKHGHSDHRSLLLGKTAEYVVRCAPCPVLLVGDEPPSVHCRQNSAEDGI